MEVTHLITNAPKQDIVAIFLSGLRVLDADTQFGLQKTVLLLKSGRRAGWVDSALAYKVGGSIFSASNNGKISY
jgi:hypothetical protein